MLKFKHMLVTPNHRMVLIDNQSNKIRVKTALECSKFTSQINYPIKGIVDGTDKYSYEFYEMLIAVQADGHLNKDSSAITFSFTKERKIKRLIDLLETLNITYSINKYKRKNRFETVIRLLSKDPSVLLLRSFFDTNKKLLTDFIDLSLDTKVKLIKSIGYWDGTYSKTKNAIVIDSTDFDFVNSLQALSHTSGFKCSLSTYTKKTGYGNTAVRRAYINLKSISRGSFNDIAEVIPYEGYIGCVSVPSGFVVVRREDKVFISGNTLNGEKLGISRGDAKAISYACVPGDTLVYSHQTSGWIPISRIKPGVHQCVSLNTDTLTKDYFTTIEQLHEFDDKEVFELKTDTGDSVRCTDDHRWFVLDHDDSKYKFVETSEYFEGDYSVVKTVDGIDNNMKLFKFLSKESLGVQKTYCLTTSTGTFFMQQDGFNTMTGNCLYGASPGKLCKMLSLSPEDGEKLYKDYWDALPALKELREKVELYWESTGNKFILGIDGRRLMARSKHSLLNLLFQGGGSIAVKYSLVFIAQRLEELGLQGDVFEDSYEQAREKVYSMIMYHDEAQYAMPLKEFKCSYFESEAEAKEYVGNKNLSTNPHYSDKMNKYYVVDSNRLTDSIQKAIQDAITTLHVKVDLGMEFEVGKTWADCH